MSRTHREPRPLSLHASTNECPSGKFAHPTRKGAKEHASNVRRRNGEHVRPYRCPLCDMWHVGHLPRSVVRGELSSEQAYGRAPLDEPETPDDVAERMGQLLKHVLGSGKETESRPYTHIYQPPVDVDAEEEA